METDSLSLKILVSRGKELYYRGLGLAASGRTCWASLYSAQDHGVQESAAQLQSLVSAKCLPCVSGGCQMSGLVRAALNSLSEQRRAQLGKLTGCNRVGFQE